MTSSENGKIKLVQRLSAKIIAFVLLILMAALTAGFGCLAAVMISENIYFTSEDKYRSEAFENLAYRAAHDAAVQLQDGDTGQIMHDCQYSNIAAIAVSDARSGKLLWRHQNLPEKGSLVYTTYWKWNEEGHLLQEGWMESESTRPADEVLADSADPWVMITVSVAPALTVKDDFYYTDRFISAAYAMRYWIFVLAAAALGLAIASFVFLLCAAGRKPGFDTVQPGWGTRVPADLLTGVTALTEFLLLEFAVESFRFYGVPRNVLAALTPIPMAVLAVGWCMSMVLRFRLGKWWRNTLIYRFFAWIGKLLRFCVRLLQKLPLIWKTAAVLGGLLLLDVIAAFICMDAPRVFLVFAILEKLLLIPAVLYLALCMRKLQKGAETIASGHLDYQVDTKYMPPDFKQHGEALNRIGEGMTAAVEERLKSERMKTELITNVSHDIKTPLTSIINYSDLIGKEPCENETVTEYAEVLHRQSVRLKRLVEDLVEASKASSGSLEMELSPCEVGVMLTQAAGEYEQRLADSQLELLTRQPEEPVKIMADGRRLWRVFDNLLNNICKYAQPGTRVYLMLEQTAGQAVISFKNISREALDLKEEELTERFVRGDSSRKTEGSGLGLSIAKSLTELQNGTLRLTVDGDLFKVTLSFPVIA